MGGWPTPGEGTIGKGGNPVCAAYMLKGATAGTAGTGGTLAAPRTPPGGRGYIVAGALVVADEVAFVSEGFLDNVEPLLDEVGTTGKAVTFVAVCALDLMVVLSVEFQRGLLDAGMAKAACTGDLKIFFAATCVVDSFLPAALFPVSSLAVDCAA